MTLLEVILAVVDAFFFPFTFFFDDEQLGITRILAALLLLALLCLALFW